MTATAALEHFWNDEQFEKEITSKAEHLGRRLECIQNRYQDDIQEVRGRGMMQGLAFNNPDEAAMVTKLAFEAGMIAERVGAHDEVVKFMMPLTITKDQLDEGITIVEQSISATFGAKKCVSCKPEKINYHA